MRAEAQAARLRASAHTTPNGDRVYTAPDLDPDVADVQERARAEARARLALVK